MPKIIKVNNLRNDLTTFNIRDRKGLNKNILRFHRTLFYRCPSCKNDLSSQKKLNKPNKIEQCSHMMRNVKVETKTDIINVFCDKCENKIVFYSKFRLESAVQISQFSNRPIPSINHKSPFPFNKFSLTCGISQFDLFQQVFSLIRLNHQRFSLFFLLVNRNFLKMEGWSLGISKWIQAYSEPKCEDNFKRSHKILLQQETTTSNQQRLGKNIKNLDYSSFQTINKSTPFKQFQS